MSLLLLPRAFQLCLRVHLAFGKMRKGIITLDLLMHYLCINSIIYGFLFFYYYYYYKLPQNGYVYQKRFFPIAFQLTIFF